MLREQKHGKITHSKDSGHRSAPQRGRDQPRVLCPLCKVQLNHPMSSLECAFCSENGARPLAAEVCLLWLLLGRHCLCVKGHGGRLGDCQTCRLEESGAVARLAREK